MQRVPVLDKNVEEGLSGRRFERSFEMGTKDPNSKRTTAFIKSGKICQPPEKSPQCTTHKTW